MTAEPVCLTLIASRKLRQELFDYLTAQRDLVSGFTASDGAGHGPTVRLQSSRPSTSRVTPTRCWCGSFWKGQDAAQLLARLKTAFAGSRLVYWIMPVMEFGVVDDGEDTAEE